MRRAITLSATLLSATAVSAALAGTTATFQFLPVPDVLSANDMSPDGRYIVGETLNGGYIYDTALGTVTTIPSPAYQARSVSDDGSQVAVNLYFAETQEDWAGVWSSATNTSTNLGSLPTGQACPSFSTSYGVSGDGTVVVGLAWINGCSGAGFRWTATDGMTQLEQLANGANRASVVNNDGSVVGGFAQGSFSRTPAIWNAAGEGTLPDPPNGDAIGEIHGMNDAGTILLGNWNGAATMWTDNAAVRTTIGDGTLLPGWTGVPLDIADNGTIVGFDFLFGNRRAWIQVNGEGALIELRAYLVANGAEIPDNVVLEVPRAISKDGRTIIGHGVSGAWIVTIDPPASCLGDLDGNGVVDGADLGLLLNAWGTATADLNGDGVTNGADLGILLNSWGVCDQVLGACCVGSGCSQLTASDCAAAGGLFLGAIQPCTPTICVDNDFCADAFDITSMINGGPIFADNSLATPAFGGGDPELPKGSPSCHWAGVPSSTHNTIWYRFAAPPNSLAMGVSICDPVGPVTIFDTVMVVYSGTCGALVEEACDDDSCGLGFRSEIELFIVEPGQTYYLMIGNPGEWSASTPGTFSFTIFTY